MIFLQQAGRNRHDHICQSLELFAAEVMGEFKAEVAAVTAACWTSCTACCAISRR